MTPGIVCYPILLWITNNIMKLIQNHIDRTYKNHQQAEESDYYKLMLQ